MCLGGQYKSLEHPYTSLKIDDIHTLLEKHSFFKLFIQEKFKLPLNITNDEILKRIKYIIENKSNIEYSSDEIPILSSHIENTTYLNPEFIENGSLQIYEYLQPPLLKITNILFFIKISFWNYIYIK